LYSHGKSPPFSEFAVSFGKPEELSPHASDFHHFTSLFLRVAVNRVVEREHGQDAAFPVGKCRGGGHFGLAIAD
jgi:hypothetical protein